MEGKGPRGAIDSRLRGRGLGIVVSLMLLAGAAVMPGSAIADGTPDPAFDEDGHETFDVIAGQPESVDDMAVDGQGRIVIVGHFPSPTDAGFVARLTPDGTLDTTFNTTGFRIFPSSVASTLTAVAVDPDGRVIAGGYRINAGFDFSILRLTASGALDTSFGVGGARVINAGGSFDLIYDLTINAAGDVFAAGKTDRSGHDNVALVKLTPGGDPDPSFGAGSGVRELAVGGITQGRAIALDSQGRIVIAGGTYTPASGTDFLTLRVLPDGNPDLSFAGSGFTVTDFGVGPYEIAKSLAIDEAGRLVVAGSPTTSFEDLGMLAARLTPSGGLDPDFDGDGRSLVRTGNGVDDLNDMRIDRAGRIVIAGWHLPDGGNFDGLMYRLTDAGGLDSTFASGGFLRDDFEAADAQAGTVAIDQDGRYLIAGPVRAGGQDLVGVARYLVDYPQPPPPPDRTVKCAGRQATIVGTAGRDALTGTPGPDVIAGLGDIDTIRGLGGRDLICGGKGSDRMTGGRGNDVMRGQAGADRLFGTRGRDRLLGGSGRDRLFGGPGKDFLNGGAGRDLLNGSRGKDRLIGGRGRDRCRGGKGRNRLTGCERRH